MSDITRTHSAFGRKSKFLIRAFPRTDFAVLPLSPKTQCVLSWELEAARTRKDYISVKKKKKS